MSTPKRLFCDDAPVSYEATPADLVRKPQPAIRGMMSAPAAPPKVGEVRVCDDAPVSYEVTDADIATRG